MSIGFQVVGGFQTQAAGGFQTAGSDVITNDIVKVLGLDAAYGSEDVARFYQTRNTQRTILGEAVGVLIDCGKEFDLSASPNISFIKPNGFVLTNSPPLSSIGRVTAFTQRGIFHSNTYGVTFLKDTDVDQAGMWICYLRNGVYESALANFFVELPIASDWILATGFWNDLAFWVDTAKWID